MNVYLSWAFYVSAPSALLVSQERAVSLRVTPTSVSRPPSTPPLSWKAFTRAPLAHWPPCRTAGVLRGERGHRSRFPPGVPEVRADSGLSAPVCFLTQRLQSLCRPLRRTTSVTYSLFLSTLLDFVIVHWTRRMLNLNCMLASLLTNGKQKCLSSILHPSTVTELSSHLYSIVLKYWEYIVLKYWE